VKAEEVYRIPPKDAPFVFKVKGPPGEDVVKAIATLDNVALVSQDALKPAGPFQEITKAERDIAIEIQGAVAKVDPKNWPRPIRL